VLVYPQLTSGALAQFPVRKRRRLRTAINRLGDGSCIKLADPPGETTEWELHYACLSDAEAAALQQFFDSVEGSLGVFTFVDPMGNLLTSSNQLDHAGWSRGPLLSMTGGLADPAGGTDGWHLSNSGIAAQSLTQALEAPAEYVYCLSVYARAAAPTTLTLFCGSTRGAHVVGTDWKRIVLCGGGAPVEFGIEVPAGGSLDVYGMQVEPQAGASAYKPSTTGGVYPRAWFRDDFLALTATDVNRHSATVNIIHANGL
jgi:hypothetical protein